MSDLDRDFFLNLRPMQYPDEIRLGSQNDGGYVVPRNLALVSTALISLGYGYDCNFERDFLRISSQCRCHLYESNIDLTSILTNLVHAIRNKTQGLRAFPSYHVKCLMRFIRMRCHPRIKYFAQEVRASPFSPSQVSISQTFEELSSIDKIFLKMDIEGGEYELLAQMDFNRCIGMIIEFHDVNNRLVEFEKSIESLKRHFVISHFHVNNYSKYINGIPNVIEITFVSKTFFVNYQSLGKKFSLPSNLDAPCNPQLGEREIIFYEL